MGFMLRAMGLQLLVVLTFVGRETPACWAAAETQVDEELEDSDIFDEDVDDLGLVDELGDGDEDARIGEDSEEQATWSSAQPGGATVVIPPMVVADSPHVSAVISNQMDKQLWIFWRRADSSEETLFKEIAASSTSTLRTYADQVIVLREGPESTSRIAAQFKMTAEDNQNFAVTSDGQAISLQNGGKVHVRFYNKGTSDLRIFWGNPDDGSELDLGLLQAGAGAYSFNSFAHHEFRVKNVETGELVYKVKTNEEPDQVYHVDENGIVEGSADSVEL